MYDFTRYLIAGDHDAAYRHGRVLMSFENNWHLNPEHALNTVFTAHASLGIRLTTCTRRCTTSSRHGC